MCKNIFRPGAQAPPAKFSVEDWNLSVGWGDFVNLGNFISL